MTEEEMDTTVGQKFVELSQAQKEIACLKELLQPIGKAMDGLGSRLVYRPEDVRATDDGFEWADDVGKQHEAQFDLAELSKRLRQLTDAVERRDRLKASLREMGHSHMVKD